MKILVKRMEDTVIDNPLKEQFLVYLMTTDNIAVTCDIARCEKDRDDIINKINNEYNKTNDKNFTLGINYIG